MQGLNTNLNNTKLSNEHPLDWLEELKDVSSWEAGEGSGFQTSVRKYHPSYNTIKMIRVVLKTGQFEGPTHS